MIARRDAAIRLGISLEMARRHNLPTSLTEAEVDALDTNPPPWLIQSRSNSTGKRPVWVQLRCDICGFAEAARPKKWWPDFTYLSCDIHGSDELPDAAPGTRRRELDGVGSRFIAIVDTPVE
ncbi:MAG TPA: hypothetical protein VNT53_11645 [Pseudolysinimonas sp.]|nr:hypothetical protein [Pseudolysinimonas sp.]